MRAILSVSDKTGIIELARFLEARGYELISSGGTHRHLQAAGIRVLEVSQVTGMKEMLGGRVKTLHPTIHGGILARRGNDQDLQELREHDIRPIDLVVVNLYPFIEGLSQENDLSHQVELIDIGGPTMLRSAAKNFTDVTVLSSPDQYDEFIERSLSDQVDQAYRQALAARVFSLMAAYDGAVADYLSGEDRLRLTYDKVMELRYGENPHQAAAFYIDRANPGYMSAMRVLAGKALSYSNIADIDAAYGVVSDFDEICVCAVKHNTPCGVALGETVHEAYQKAYAGDPVSIFGGIVACNRTIDGETASQMIEIFLEVVVAPDFTSEALAVFEAKPNLRLVQMRGEANRAKLLKSVSGGVLVQEPDYEFSEELTTVSLKAVTPEQKRDLIFGMKVVKHIKSNAIVVVKDEQTLGIGGGQTNRIDAAHLALRGALKGSVLASDGFFPFDDVVRAAHAAGISAILQPGGSIQDQASIDACDELGLAMVFSGRRHFKH